MGLVITRINAREAVIEAGRAMLKASSPRLWARAIIMGITIAAVTELIEHHSNGYAREDKNFNKKNSNMISEARINDILKAVNIEYSQ